MGDAVSTKHCGITVPFTPVRGGPSVFPGPGGPGYHDWICDGCGESAARFYMGGIDVDWAEERSRLDNALEFHMRNCPKLEKMEPQAAKVRE